MFVSSYNTYISTVATNKHTREKEVDSKSSTSQSSKVFEIPKTELQALSNLPVDYILKSKTFNNKLELKRQEFELANPQKQDSPQTQVKNNSQITSFLSKEFLFTKTILSAKKAYEDNSKTFSLIKVPGNTQDQTPKIDTRLPIDEQELQMRHTMVNTYIDNDRYYKVTA